MLSTIMMKSNTKQLNMKPEVLTEEQKHSAEISLKNMFPALNSYSVWQGLQQITQYKQKPAKNDPTLPDQLNHFYSRFHRKNTTKASGHSGPMQAVPARLRFRSPTTSLHRPAMGGEKSLHEARHQKSRWPRQYLAINTEVLC